MTSEPRFLKKKELDFYFVPRFNSCLRRFDEMVMEREEKKIIDEQLQFKFVTTHLALIIRFLETVRDLKPQPFFGSP